MTFAGSGRTKITAGSRQPGMFTRQPSPRNVSSGGGINEIALMPANAVFPDGSEANPATLEKIVANPSFGVGLHFIQALFDASTNEALTWYGVAPSNADGTAQVELVWGAKVTTGNVIWRAYFTYTQAEFTDLDGSTAAYGSSVSSAAIAVPGTAGQYKKTSITGLGAILGGDLYFIMIERNAANGSDTAAADATLLAATLTWA